MWKSFVKVFSPKRAPLTLITPIDSRKSGHTADSSENSAKKKNAKIDVLESPCEELLALARRDPYFTPLARHELMMLISAAMIYYQDTPPDSIRQRHHFLNRARELERANTILLTIIQYKKDLR